MGGDRRANGTVLYDTIKAVTEGPLGGGQEDPEDDLEAYFLNDGLAVSCHQLGG